MSIDYYGREDTCAIVAVTHTFSGLDRRTAHLIVSLSFFDGVRCPELDAGVRWRRGRKRLPT